MKRRLRDPIRVLALLLFAMPALAGSPRPRIAIIIDDLGYERAAGERAIALPGPLAYAVLPGAPRSGQLAEQAHARGKEVLLHLPLQAQKDSEPAEPMSLTLDMSQQQFHSSLSEYIAAVPHISGINTHRGSLLTMHPGHMSWLMDAIVERGDLFFVDSYTTAQSVALLMAQESGVPSMRRDVFLDPDRSPETVAREFERLKMVARQQGFAVGIGHPYSATLDFLVIALPLLEAEGFELVGIGDLIAAVGTASRSAEISSGE